MPSTIWRRNSKHIFQLPTQRKQSCSLHTFYQCSIWITASSVNVGLLRCSTSGIRQSTNFSEENYSKWCIFKCCNNCSLCFDLSTLILFLDFLAFSALVSAFQFLTRKHCLQFSGLSTWSVTFAWNWFLIKKIVDRLTCCRLCGD